MAGVGWLHTKSFQRATRCHSRLRSSLAWTPAACAGARTLGVMGILPRGTLNMVRTVQQNSGPDLSIGLLRDRIGHRPWILVYALPPALITTLCLP